MIDVVKHVKASGELQSDRVPRGGPGAKTTEFEVRMALVCASTDDGRPLILSGTNLMSMVGRFR